MASAQQQQAYLEAMGIQSWVRREQPQPGSESPALEAAPSPQAEAPVAERPAMERSLGEKPMSGGHMSGGESPDHALGEAELVVPPPARPATEGLDWAALRAKVASCTACELHKSRTQTVFGVGSENADWLIIGEAPGAEEDRQGEPFVGRAGQLLNNMLKAVGLRREQVYIANILKCRPPNNRDPRPEEIIQCEAYLKRQVELIAPKVILAVGRIAAHNLLKVDTPLGKMRGQVHHYGETPVVVTYHPAYLLRTPRDKAKAWADLCFARAVMRGEQP